LYVYKKQIRLETTAFPSGIETGSALAKPLSSRRLMANGNADKMEQFTPPESPAYAGSVRGFLASETAENPANG
jgi:hypothetical protein